MILVMRLQVRSSQFRLPIIYHRNHKLCHSNSSSYSSSHSKQWSNKSQTCRDKLCNNRWAWIWPFNSSKCSKLCKLKPKTSRCSTFNQQTTFRYKHSPNTSNWILFRRKTSHLNSHSLWLQPHHKFKPSKPWHLLQWSNLQCFSSQLKDYPNQKQRWK